MGREDDGAQSVSSLGCFGMASVVNPASQTCQKCPVSLQCKQKAIRALEAVQKVLPVANLIHDLRVGYTENYELSPEQQKILAGTPSRVRDRLRSLFLKRFDVLAAQDFHAGKNPFPESGAKHMKLAGDLLLKGGFTRASLRQQFIEHFGWSTATAFTQVSNTISLLRGLGVVYETSGKFTIPNA